MRKTPSIFSAVGVLELGQALAVAVIFLIILVGVIYFLNKSDEFELVTELQSPLNWIPISITFLGFIVYPIIMIIVGVRGIFQALSIYIGKRKWISAAGSITVPIIERSNVYNEYAEFREQEWECSFTIRLPAVFASSIGNQDITVSVDHRTYSNYERKDTARIYYDLDEPLTFVFDGE